MLGAIAPLAAGVDADGDGFGEGLDCNDKNDQVWTVPGEALQIRFTTRTTLVWSPPAAPIGVRRIQTFLTGRRGRFGGCEAFGGRRASR